LIELLVVIAIIAILAAILFPVFAQAKAAAKKAASVSNAKQINLGQLMYMNDYDDQFVPYFSYWNPQNSTTAQPSQYWPGLISPYIQKAAQGATPAGGQQILATDLSKVFFDPIETFNVPASGTYGNIASWGISDDIVNWWEPPGVATTYIPVNGSIVSAPANALIFVETWDWLSAGGPGKDPGYPGSALALSIFDHWVTKLCTVPPIGNAAYDTIQAPYNSTVKAGWPATGIQHADSNGQNVVGFIDGHVKAVNAGQLYTQPTYWSISGTGQWP